MDIQKKIGQVIQSEARAIAVMLAISDGLALALMELTGATSADFGLRHHGGYLGRRARTDNLPEGEGGAQ